MLPTFVQTLRRYFGGRRRAPVRNHNRLGRLLVEQLEDRVVPTVTIDVSEPNVSLPSTDGNVIVAHMELDPSGTGVIDPFLRVHQNVSEQGYNTSARHTGDLLDDITDQNFTRNIQLSDIGVATVDGVAYREFHLDIGEDSGGVDHANEFLDFAQLKFFHSSAAGQHGYTGSAIGGASLVYDLDGGGANDDNFTLRDLTSGNGASDYFVYVKDSVFSGVASSDYIYMYCQFGNPAPTSDGSFEEWTAKKPDNVGPTETFILSGTKYYDANANGSNNGEAGVPGWQVYLDDDTDPTNGVVAIAYTSGSGNYSFDNNTLISHDAAHVLVTGLTAGIDYFVYEGTATETNWLQTDGVGGYSFQLLSSGALAGGFPKDADNNSVAPNALNFGNLCLGDGGGLTLGFWSNKNGKAILAAHDLDWRNQLNALHLRDASGNNFDISLTKSFNDAYTCFRTWLLNATAQNMAYMLSAQLAAMQLNVSFGSVSGGALVYAPGCGNTGVGNNFITIANLMAAADGELAAHGYTPAGDPNRAYQECLKDALDDANNNLNFVHSSFNDCPYTFNTPDLL